ncbi:ABC transporter substrate-binding protein [Fundicoccus culcitae]|uniref:ABC transporter substrate-binding protein n=1 Tax=Fundicoccus culcitae TaxID=2969821 RepID=A0ABY5P6F2_9LACT|nr:ABC transporter substrate-binding protein [Fundicoccus culcitae]UUX34302.1 ABC transporter substrate-binding protein [Fundicoccus culcitae]
MKIRKFGITMLTALSLVPLSLSSQSIAAQETIKIGSNYELSGDAASYGQAMENALQLAVKKANEEGWMFDGSTVEVVSLDNTSDITESASIAQRLVSENVVGIVGPALTGTSQAQIPIITEAQIPVILPAATNDGITLDEAGNVLEYLFRVCFENSVQGEAAAIFAVENLGSQKAVIISDYAADYSIGLADAFKGKFEELGGEVVIEESFQTGDTDYTSVLTSLITADYDAIYIPSYYTEGGLIIKQARELGITAPILSGDGFASPTLVELAGAENANDIYYTSHFSSATEDPYAQEFLADYEEMFGREADGFAALGYDAATLLLDAINRAESTDPQAITDAIAATVDFQGVTGTFTINEKHDPIKPATMIELQNGEIVSAIRVGE